MRLPPRGGADLLIGNRYGKHEAEGRGFRNVIAEALARDVPVLVGLNGQGREAFDAFAGGLATHLPPERDTLARRAGAIVPLAAEPA